MSVRCVDQCGCGGYGWKGAIGLEFGNPRSVERMEGKEGEGAMFRPSSSFMAVNGAETSLLMRVGPMKTCFFKVRFGGDKNSKLGVFYKLYPQKKKASVLQIIIFFLLFFFLK